MDGVHLFGNSACGFGSGFGGGGHSMMLGYGFGGLLTFLVFIAVVGVVIYVIVCYTTGRCGGMMRSSSSALDLLKERYVKGEIDKEEFEQKKKDLQ